MNSRETAPTLPAFDELADLLTPLVWQVARGHGLDQPTADLVVRRVWRWVLGTRPAPMPHTVGWLIRVADREARLAGRNLPSRDRTGHAFWRLPLECQRHLRLVLLAGQTEDPALAAALDDVLRDAHPPDGCLAVLRDLLADPESIAD